VNEWQPIETAPKLERKTVLGAEGAWVGEMFWHDGSECYGHRGEAGWFSVDDWNGLLTASNVHPTHWMFLPPPPSTPKQGEGEK
jgi:hypothetical protein